MSTRIALPDGSRIITAPLGAAASARSLAPSTFEEVVLACLDEQVLPIVAHLHPDGAYDLKMQVRRSDWTLHITGARRSASGRWTRFDAVHLRCGAGPDVAVADPVQVLALMAVDAPPAAEHLIRELHDRAAC